MATVRLFYLLFFAACTLALAGAYDPYLPQLPLIPTPQDPSRQPGRHDFKLRHMFHHGGPKYPQLHRRLDVGPETTVWIEDEHHAWQEPMGSLKANSRDVQMQRLSDQRKDRIDLLQAAGRAKGSPVTLPESDWSTERIIAPNVTDVDTILTLAKMTLDAYADKPGNGDWQDVGAPFNHSTSFGWYEDGLRGHVFADDTNSTIVISIKGTSIGLFPDGPTGSIARDRENDNLFFSCCCGSDGSLFTSPVCDCATDTYSCNATCTTQSLLRPNTYYTLAKELYWNVTDLYPKSDVWFVGHSLGGSLAALLGATFFLPAISFEAPGEAMAAKRLGLPTPPGYQLGAKQQDDVTYGAFHFGHTADPLYTGNCNGWPCSWDGFAMQSQCHAGYECVWDTVKDFGWAPWIPRHKILFVVDELLPKYDKAPECKVVKNCTDCYKWKFFESHDSDDVHTTKKWRTSSLYTQTRTSICQTPGWWGCLDESTTTGATVTSTSAPPTSTCKTPGWFGCLDRSSTISVSTTTTTTTTASTTSTSTVTTSSTTTCKTPGWFGRCLDDRATSVAAPPHRVSSVTATATCSPPSTSCRHPGIVWGCRDKATPGSSPPSATPAITPR